MRKLPFLQHHHFGLTRLRALAWATQGLGENKLQIVQRAAGDALAALLHVNSDGCPLIVDSRDMQRIEDDAMAHLNELLRGGRYDLFFVNSSKVFTADLQRMLGDATIFPYGSESVACFGKSSTTKQRVTELMDEARSFETDQIENFVASCLHRHTEGRLERMESTLLRSNGIFDAREIISDSSRFTWVALALADKLDSLVARTAFPQTTRLLAVSLRGSPFAGAVSLLSKSQMKVEIVDHMGPKHRILEEHHLVGRHRSSQYIYVGDFVIGGTELKVARTYADTRGSVLKYALVVGSLLRADEYKMSTGIELVSLATLSEISTDVRFEFLGERTR